MMDTTNCLTPQVGGYRDLMLCVVFKSQANLRIIGEIQVHK